METAGQRPIAGAEHRLNHPDFQRAFGKMRRSVAVYGAFSVAVLLVVVILSINGEQVSSFMWGRTGGMFASAAVTYWLLGLAARGSRSAYVRVCVIAVVVPIAVIAIDSIPGALPLWFVVLQVAGAVALIPTAFLVNRSELRAAYRTSR
ncbi:hypothetical protein [Streptomyces sp. 150FB]|uniref:hypothetical protein n=1 Tax=Streptomyces sp. 150FB TaxID=1576605 RepID=UPI00069922B8|nr:hypothetical protein [Streptomyces sp. 150FB]